MNARHLLNTRLARVLLSRRGGGRSAPAILQLVLISVCHLAVYLVITFTTAPVTVWASQFWYHRGITRSAISDLRVQPFWETGEYIVPVEALLVYLFLEAALGWFGYRFLNRKPKPRWYRFVRFWYRSQLYGLVAFPAMSLAGDASPGAPANLTIGWLSIAAFCAYLTFLPGILARREAERLARRLPSGRCRSCGYALRGLTSGICPECGTQILKTSRFSAFGFALLILAGTLSNGCSAIHPAPIRLEEAQVRLVLIHSEEFVVDATTAEELRKRPSAVARVRVHSDIPGAPAGVKIESYPADALDEIVDAITSGHPELAVILAPSEGADYVLAERMECKLKKAGVGVLLGNEPARRD